MKSFAPLLDPEHFLLRLLSLARQQAKIEASCRASRESSSVYSISKLKSINFGGEIFLYAL